VSHVSYLVNKSLSITIDL